MILCIILYLSIIIVSMGMKFSEEENVYLIYEEIEYYTGKAASPRAQSIGKEGGNCCSFEPHTTDAKRRNCCRKKAVVMRSSLSLEMKPFVEGPKINVFFDILHSGERVFGLYGSIEIK